MHVILQIRTHNRICQRVRHMAAELSEKEKEVFPSRNSDNVQSNVKHHNKCVKRLEHSIRRSKRSGITICNACNATYKIMLA